MAGSDGRLQIEHVPTTDLKPDPENPRVISDEAKERLRQGLRRFGRVLPIVARREDMRIVGGHQNHQIALEEGEETVPVVFVDGLSEKEAKALNVLLNNPKAQGQYVVDRLVETFEDFDEDLIEAAGFTMEEIQEMDLSAEIEQSTDFLDGYLDTEPTIPPKTGKRDGGDGGEGSGREGPTFVQLSFSFTVDDRREIMAVLGKIRDEHDALSSTSDALLWLVREHG